MLNQTKDFYAHTVEHWSDRKTRIGLVVAWSLALLGLAILAT